MPIKNIVTDQIVTKAKLERAKELRREMTPAENCCGGNSAPTSWESAFGGSRSFRDSSLIFTVTPSALSGTSPKSDIETLDDYQDFILSDLGEEGWG